MPTVKVRNLKNKEVGEVTLPDAVFGVELNEALIHSAVMNYQANGRAGTSATKTRGNVSGSGRKLWKQKGTGRARIASLRSPLWKGGGNVHGPQPRDWSYQMPKKMRRGALRSALSERLREGNLIIIDEFGFNTPRTIDFLGAMSTLALGDGKKPTKTLIIDSRFANPNVNTLESVQAFASALANKPLQCLELSQINLGLKGVEALAQTLKEMKNLTSLNLHRCEITPAGIESLKDCFFNNRKSLK